MVQYVSLASKKGKTWESAFSRTIASYVNIDDCKVRVQQNQPKPVISSVSKSPKQKLTVWYSGGKKSWLKVTKTKILTKNKDSDSGCWQNRLNALPRNVALEGETRRSISDQWRQTNRETFCLRSAVGCIAEEKRSACFIPACVCMFLSDPTTSNHACSECM